MSDGFKSKSYEFVHYGNEAKTGWGINGTGNTVTPITKATYESETGQTAPSNMGSHALKIVIEEDS